MYEGKKPHKVRVLLARMSNFVPRSQKLHNHQVYQAVMDQMSYVQQIVGFMDFDQEAVTGGAAPGTAGLAESPQAATFEEVAQEINERVKRPAESGGADSGERI